MSVAQPVARPWRRGIAALVAGLMLASGLASVPAHAETTFIPSPNESALAASLTKEGVLLDQHTSNLAPGLDLTTFQRRQDRAWVSGYVMTMDTAAENLSLSLEDGDSVAGANKTVSQFVKNTPDVVAAVNADFFDMNATDAPVHGNISAKGIRTLSQGSHAFTMTEGKVAIERLMSASELVREGRPADDNGEGGVDELKLAISGVNSPTVSNGIALFNSTWGTYRLDGLTAGPSKYVVRVRAGEVTAVGVEPQSLAPRVSIAPDETVLIARGQSSVDALSALQVGDKVRLDVKANINPELAVGGNAALLTNGEITVNENVTAGRTAVGISEDGSKLFFVVIDGRRFDADGMTLTELAKFMRDLGAWNALNLDGGGSTTLVGRPAGASDPVVLNQPSDGNERLVTNALVIRSTASTKLGGVHVETASEQRGSREAASVALMPGLTRTLQATGLDKAGRPVATFGKYAASNNAVSVAGIGERAVVTGAKTGSGKLTYSAAGFSQDIPFKVFGKPVRIRANASLIALKDLDSARTLALTAEDADGNRVPVETSDVIVETTGPIEVIPSGLASWRVAGTEGGAGTIKLTVGELTTSVAVTIGTVEQLISDFSDLSQWKWTSARTPSGGIEATTGPDGGPALRIIHDFTASTATRGSYATATAEMPVPGQPQALSLWMKGDGNGTWARIQIRKGDGTSTNVDAPQGLVWHDWRKFTFPIPAGTAYPIKIMAVRLMETRGTVTYRGDMSVARLSALVPAETELPVAPYITDPVVVTNGTVDDRPLRVAVMSDAQFVGRDPNSYLVQGARRTLKEIVAAKPDFLVINGDFTDESNDIDFDLAKQILTEEIGDQLPYQYVPGNHEIMGQPISNFIKYFGSNTSVHDLNGTRLITLDSSSGKLSAGSLDQLKLLEDNLAEAAANPDVTGVVVFHHHPIDDPSPDKLSQLADRTEAAALDRIFAEFRAGGKQIAHINAHVGTFHASSRDGVSRIINGNSAKAPSTAANRGGFVGWTMLGIDPARGTVSSDPETVADRIGWLQAETRPWVEEVKIAAEDREGSEWDLAEGESLSIAGSFTQDGRTIPVTWPVSAQWSGDRIAFAGQEAPADAVVNFDPNTGIMTGLAKGKAELRLTVNGHTATVTIGKAETTPDPTPKPEPTPTPDPAPRKSVRVTKVFGDHTGDGIPDVLSVDGAGTLILHAGNRKGEFTLVGSAGTGYASIDKMVQISDLTGDGRSDVLVRRRKDSSLWLYRSLGNGYLEPVRQIGSRWSGMDIIVPAFDMSGDGKRYIVARRSNDGALYRYEIHPTGLKEGQQIGQRWGGMKTLVSVGDIDGNGRAEIVGIHNNGTMWTYQSTAKGGLAEGKQTGHGWGSTVDVFTNGDLDGDRRLDLVARRLDGAVYTYRTLGIGKKGIPVWGDARKVMPANPAVRLMA